jgi:hypothetical protein
MARSLRFEEQLSREIELFIQETMDGCVDCIALGVNAPCYAHNLVFMELVINPRKHIRIGGKSDGTAARQT